MRAGFRRNANADFDCRSSRKQIFKLATLWERDHNYFSARSSDLMFPELRNEFPFQAVSQGRSRRTNFN
jgi:hypothetical protein